MTTELLRKPDHSIKGGERASQARLGFLNNSLSSLGLHLFPQGNERMGDPQGSSKHSILRVRVSAPWNLLPEPEACVSAVNSLTHPHWPGYI